MDKILEIIFKKKIKMAIDNTGLYFCRSFKDGITFFEPCINIDFYRGNHKPSFKIQLIILNFMIFSFEYYNIYHEEESVNVNPINNF